VSGFAVAYVNVPNSYSTAICGISQLAGGRLGLVFPAVKEEFTGGAWGDE
jgi:hypothetical protein